MEQIRIQWGGEKEFRRAVELRQEVIIRRDAALIRGRCKTLKGFVKEAWRVLEPSTPFVDNWHIDAICLHLEAVSRGEINRLLINVPPGSSKSLIVSVLWPAWEWAEIDAGLRYLSTSFNITNVVRDSRKMRDLVASNWYQTLWPHVVLDRQGELSYSNTATGNREGVAFRSLTSKRGDRLLIDDPHSTETAESDAERETAARMFREGALDRLNDIERSAIVVIMQRLHMDDVSGVIETMPEQGFVHLMIPMRFEAERRCSTRIGWIDPRTMDGELMDKVRFPEIAMQKLETGKGDYAWAGQYQQRPAPREGGIFPVDLIKIETGSPAGGEEVRGWDIAGSTRKTSPYTAGVRLKRLPNGDIWIVDCARGRLKIAAAEALIVDTANEDGVRVKQSLPQDPGQAGLSQKNQLASKLEGLNFRFSPETGSKEDRAIPIASQVQAGKVFMVRGLWNIALIEEMRNFPSGSFKDQVDALSRAYSELIPQKKKRMGVGGFRGPTD
jgi:predicted phage terminase large subunit-like protein